MTTSTISKRNAKKNLSQAHGVLYEELVAKRDGWILSSSPTAPFDGFKVVSCPSPITGLFIDAEYHMTCKMYRSDAPEISLQSLRHMAEYTKQSFVFYLAFYDDMKTKEITKEYVYEVPTAAIKHWFRNLHRVVNMVYREKKSLRGNDAEWNELRTDIMTRYNAKQQPIKISLGKTPNSLAKCKIKTKVLLELLANECTPIMVNPSQEGSPPSCDMVPFYFNPINLVISEIFCIAYIFFV